jgi:hypothetical protein
MALSPTTQHTKPLKDTSVVPLYGVVAYNRAHKPLKILQSCRCMSLSPTTQRTKPLKITYVVPLYGVVAYNTAHKTVEKYVFFNFIKTFGSKSCKYTIVYRIFVPLFVL